MKLSGDSMLKLLEGQGGLSGLSPHRPNGSRDGQTGRFERMNGGQSQLKRGQQTRVHSDQIVLVMARQEAGLQ